jgi:chaperonin GroEL
VALDYELGPPKITKDGVTVAKHIELRDSWQDVGCKLLKFPAHETNLHAGDGTTTATILCSHILSLGLSFLSKGHHPVLLKEGLLKAAAAVDTFLLSRSIPVTTERELEAICAVACNNDRHMARLVLDGVLLTGRDGAFLVEEGNSAEDRLTVKNRQVADGFVVPRGYASEMFGLSEFE